jgi:hypothetical protein
VHYLVSKSVADTSPRTPVRAWRILSSLSGYGELVDYQGVDMQVRLMTVTSPRSPVRAWRILSSPSRYGDLVEI